MTKLSAFKQDSNAIENGEWVPLGDEYGDVEIFTRGFTDAYFDAQSAKQRKAARGVNGDTGALPTAIRRAINISCLVKHALCGDVVRNLTDDDGVPVTKDAFLELLEDPDYRELAGACFRAVGTVGQRRSADLEEAAGN